MQSFFQRVAGPGCVLGPMAGSVGRNCLSTCLLPLLSQHSLQVLFPSLLPAGLDEACGAGVLVSCEDNLPHQEQGHLAASRAPLPTCSALTPRNSGVPGGTAGRAASGVGWKAAA